MTGNPFISSHPAPAPAMVPMVGGGEQDLAVAKVLAWHQSRRGKQIFRLFGPAGTGKTTIAREIAKRMTGPAQFAAFSAKAASVLRQKGNSNATTIHKLIYTPIDVDAKGKVTFNLNNASAVRGAALVVIDECSMVNAKLGRDLESFGVPILVLGDKAQLPPIDGAGYFSNGAADFELTQIHRQAANDPIITLATDVRAGKKLKLGTYQDSSVISARDLRIETVIDADQVLAGTHPKIGYLNARIRQILGYPHGEPVVGDKLVCRKNSARQNLFNGEIWFVEKIIEHRNGAVHMEIRSDIDDRKAKVAVDLAFFNVQSRDELDVLKAHSRGKHAFTFGYVLTVHHAQGSEWDRVVLFDETTTWTTDTAKWLYTGITRASKSITVVRP